ncbi:MAG TPA: hypothetical protein PK586_02630 [Casimicrobium sp.]|jgi:hypothetical protein|nr:hypothetical protein [Casimicrobium sp.]
MPLAINLNRCVALACCLAASICLNGLAAAQTSELVDVQVYENTTAFPGEFRYFMTARPADKAYLAANPQMAWKPLYVFSAYAADSAPPGAVAVCRFYLPTLATHFYSAQPAECDQFKRDPLFVFEGNDFYVSLPSETNTQIATCGQSDAPVYRAYNEGARRHVSGNHIYGPDVGLANYLASNAGWRFEGVVMCVPKTPRPRTSVIVAGRASVARDEVVAPDAPGAPIAQIVSTQTLSSTHWIDPLRGESDWQTRTGFDPIRGKIYLVRATTLRTRKENGPYLNLTPEQLLQRLSVVETTRAIENVMELDVATGAARYLNVPGTFTDVHFDARTRLLMLAGPDASGEASVQWFDPLANRPVGSVNLGVQAFQVSVKYIGSPVCTFYVNSATYVVYVFPDTIFTSYSVGPKSAGDHCVQDNMTARAMTSGQAIALSTGIVVGDAIFGSSDVSQQYGRDIARYRLDTLAFSAYLPRTDAFGLPPNLSDGNYQASVLARTETDVLVLLRARYEVNPSKLGYFMLRYRNGQLIETTGPLTEAIRYFANSPLESWQGKFPPQFNGDFTELVRRTSSPFGELWTILPVYGRVTSISRADGGSYAPIGDIPLDVPGAWLHLH